MAYFGNVEMKEIEEYEKEFKKQTQKKEIKNE